VGRRKRGLGAKRVSGRSLFKGKVKSLRRRGKKRRK